MRRNPWYPLVLGLFLVATLGAGGIAAAERATVKRWEQSNPGIIEQPLSNPVNTESPVPGNTDVLAPIWGLVVSPDLTRIAYWTLGAETTAAPRHPSLQVLDLSTGIRTAVAHSEGAVSDPAWSPDAKRLAWIAEQTLFYLKFGDDARSVAIVPQMEMTPPTPLWSEDGQRLLFSLPGDVAPAYWSVDLQGEQLRRVPAPAHSESALPPDDSLLAQLERWLPEYVRQQAIPDSLPAPLAPPDLATMPILGAEVPWDWYRYQGEWDSGAMAHSNCGPSSVAMAIEFNQNDRWVAISDIRAYIGGASWTYASSIQSALSHWGVPNQRLWNMSDIRAALAERGSIMLVHLWMSDITPGADYQTGYSNPSYRSGRYYAYSSSHWIVLYGITPDGNWVLCHDPNVWEGDGVYWYSDGTPKGKSRLYAYTELASSIVAYQYEAIEVPAGWLPTATPPATPTRTLAPSSTPRPTETALPSLTPTHTQTATITPTPDPSAPPPTIGPEPTLPPPTPTTESSPTATASPMPTYTPPPTPVPRNELLQNGGFESDERWSFPSTPARGRRVNTVAHSGQWSTLLGILPSETNVYAYSTAHQRVSIPADAESLIVSFWYLPGAETPITEPQQWMDWKGYEPVVSTQTSLRVHADQPREHMTTVSDWQRVLLLNTAYLPEETLLNVRESHDNWRYAEYQINGYAGRELVLYLEVINDGAGGRTWMYIDDISVATPGDWMLTLPCILR